MTVVLPAEYGIDPTGVGGAMGLTEMGEIKTQLAEEAEADRQMDATGDEQSSLLDASSALFVGTAHAQEAEAWRDETSFTLAPGDTAEWKLVMEEGETAEYRVVVEGGRVNFDLHGHGGGRVGDLREGPRLHRREGEIVAAFAGEHGWFWRNRDDARHRDGDGAWRICGVQGRELTFEAAIRPGTRRMAASPSSGLAEIARPQRTAGRVRFR